MAIKNEENIIISPCNENCSFCFLNYTDILSENYLFRNVGKEEIGIIIKKVHHRVREYSKGEIIAFEGDRLEDLMLIVKGSVVGEMMDFEGKILRVEKLAVPESIASAFLFGGNGSLPVTVTATEDTKLLLIPKKELLLLFSDNSAVMKNFLDIISDRAQFMSRKIKLMSLNNIKSKISMYLLDLVKKNGKTEFTLPHTQKELAEIFATTRPSVGRAFREMHNSGCLDARGKNIKILDPSRLSLLLGNNSL